MDVHIGINQLLPPISALGGLILLYTGPETVMPLASTLAALIGVLLILWRRVVRFMGSAYQYCSKKVSQLSARNKAHGHLKDDPHGDPQV